MELIFAVATSFRVLGFMKLSCPAEMKKTEVFDL